MQPRFYSVTVPVANTPTYARRLRSRTKGIFFVAHPLIGGRRLIRGFTPVTRSRLETSLHSNRSTSDNGCGFGGLPETGKPPELEPVSMTIFL